MIRVGLSSPRLSLAASLLVISSCGQEHDASTAVWALVHRDLRGALLSVWGSGSDDVWAVGADSRDGQGPLLIHYDGSRWQRVPTGQTQGDLWWVFGFDDGTLYLGGDGGVILRMRDGQFERMNTPGNNTVFGLWGTSPRDMWAVGGASDATGGFAWRLVDDTWVDEPSLPTEVASSAALWKIFGTATDDAYVVGSNGVALHWDGRAMQPSDTGVGSSLFTVHADADGYVAVGGLATGIIVELDGTAWRNVTPEPPPMGLAGVALGADGTGIAVGSFGTVYTRSAGGWSPVELGVAVPQNLHGAWIDDEGGLWAVGGQTLSPPLTQGVLLYFGTGVPAGGL